MHKNCFPLHREVLPLDMKNKEVLSVFEKLQSLGYLEKESPLNGEVLNQALTAFQSYYKLNVTGLITLQTLKMLNRKHCGVKDPLNIITAGVAAGDPFAYFNFNNRWKDQSQVNFFIQNGTGDMTGEAAVIQQAFDVWAEHIPINFVRVFDQTTAQIVLSWQVGAHGGGAGDSAFDGSGGTLAHANLFNGSAFVHFDDAENWNTNDLLSTAIHEIGHTLGLHHSNEGDAIMFSFENGRTSLHEFDIRGIKSLYPRLHNFGNSRAARVSLAALRSEGGTDVRRVDFSETRRIAAWGQRTMVDSLTDFDRDNAWAIEIIEIDCQRIEPILFGGRHFGTQGAPSNVHPGAFVGRANSVTFRMSSLHTSDLDSFGVGIVLVLN